MEVIVNLIAPAVIGTLCAFIAHGRGRSPVGWFFIGFFFACIGLIVLLVIPDLKKLEAEKNRMLKENRKLREEVRMNREAASRKHAEIEARLKVHDRALRVDTSERSDALLTDGGAETSPAANATVDAADLLNKKWFFMNETGKHGPLPFREFQLLWQSGEFRAENYVKTSEMNNWMRVQDVSGLRSILDA
ncbi:MAG: DUF4339 domain-containing protein [Planctomycetes bacterium]|nr:DUF4339 domain-containing protein [Planctomycetota bacterium]